MRKFIEAIEQAPDREAERFAAFEHLANLQRGEPELAMLRVQNGIGGGVLSWMVEHVGDLTHRMCEHPNWIPFSGYESVKPKVDRAMGFLNSTYIDRQSGLEGFAAEHDQNMRNNAHYRGIDREDHDEKVKDLLARYAAEHAKLPVYNEAQRLARDAAICLGHCDFDGAKLRLGTLQKWLITPQEWNAHASQFHPNFS